MIFSFFNKSSFFSYILALVLLALALYSHEILSISFPYDAEKHLTLLLLSSCMLAVDWSVKQRYWASKANYHLVIFSFSVFALPIESWNNWLLMFFFFFWIALNYLVGIDPSGNQNKKVFNAFFFFYLGGLFYPQGVIFFPLLWGTLFIQGRLNARTAAISLLPLVSLYLLEAIFTFIFPQGFLIALPKIEQVEFSLPWKSIFHHNFWWLSLLLLLLFSMFRHYIDMSTKSAAYGLGIYVLWTTAAAAIGFGLFFQSQNQWAWLLLIMIVSALSTRFFEGIKRNWLRELLFLLLLSVLLCGKYGYPV